MPYGNENSYDVTPSRRKQPSIQDILSQDNVSPLKNRSTTPAIGNLTPMPPKTLKPSSSVGDIIQNSSSSKPVQTPTRVVPQRNSAFFDSLQNADQQTPKPAATSTTTTQQSAPLFVAPAPVQKITAGDIMQKENYAVLKVELEKERVARQEIADKLMKMTKARVALELDFQKLDDAHRKLEAALKEEKATGASSLKTLQETEQIIRSQLSKEVEKRKKLEEDLFAKTQMLFDEQVKLGQKSNEAVLIKGKLEESEKALSLREKQLAEKEKARQRRSIGFHEEQKTRMQLEQEIDDLQISYSELQEKYESIVASLESRLAVEKERVGRLTAVQDTTSHELAKEKETTASLQGFNAFIKAENLCLAKTVEELQSQLRTSHQAIQILEQRSQIDKTQIEREHQMTKEQLEIIKAAEFQASLHLSQVTSVATSEKKNRQDAEEKLAQEQKFKVDLEEQLKMQKTEVIPFMQHHLSESQAKIAELEKALQAARIENENLHRELLGEKKLRIEASEALVDEMGQKKDLEKILIESQEKHEQDLKKEKTAKLALQNDLSFQLAANRTF